MNKVNQDQNNNKINDIILNDNIELSEKSQDNEKIFLSPSEFDSPAKVIFSANEYEKIINNEENLNEISDSIYQIVYEKYPHEAGKITGMIKEFGLKKMNLLLSKPEDLDRIIEKAYDMIMDD